MDDKTVRRPSSEPADPFGDTPWPATPPRSQDVGRPSRPSRPLAPLGDIEVPLGFEPEPAPEGFGSTSRELPTGLQFPAPNRPGMSTTFGGLVAAGTARVVLGLVILAITTGGFGFFVDLSNDGPPNVPDHILDACRQARVESSLGASVGSHIDFQQDGSDQLVTFRTPSDEEWTCRWNASARWATVEG